MARVTDVNAVLSGRSRFQTVPIGSVAYSSFGNATTTVAGTHYRAEIFVNRKVTLKGIAVLNAGTIGADKGLVALYDSTGSLVASSAAAGATTVGANAFQSYDFTATVDVKPGQYWAVYQSNGTTDNVRTIAASTFIETSTGSATGTFATALNFTPPTTFTANVGPVAYAYTV